MSKRKAVQMVTDVVRQPTVLQHFKELPDIEFQCSGQVFYAHSELLSRFKFFKDLIADVSGVRNEQGRIVIPFKYGTDVLMSIVNGIYGHDDLMLKIVVEKILTDPDKLDKYLEIVNASMYNYGYTMITTVIKKMTKIHPEILPVIIKHSKYGKSPFFIDLEIIYLKRVLELMVIGVSREQKQIFVTVATPELTTLYLNNFPLTRLVDVELLFLMNAEKIGEILTANHLKNLKTEFAIRIMHNYSIETRPKICKAFISSLALRYKVIKRDQEAYRASKHW